MSEQGGMRESAGKEGRNERNEREAVMDALASEWPGIESLLQSSFVLL